MTKPNQPDPGRRSLFVDFLRALNRWTAETGEELVGAIQDASKALKEPLAEVTQASRELEAAVQEAATAVTESLDPGPPSGTTLADLESYIADIEASKPNLEATVHNLTATSTPDRAETVTLSERLAESDARLADIQEMLAALLVERETMQQNTQPIAALQERAATAQAWLLALFKKLVIGATGAALYEAFVSDEIYPWLKDRLRAVFNQAVSTGELETSPLPPPTSTPGPDATPDAETLSQSRRRPATKFAPDLVRVGAGWFWFGADKRRDSQARDHEQSITRHHLPTYYIGRFPVTNQEYRIFVLATGHRAPDHWKDGKIPADTQDHPVTYVSQEDALAYCAWLAQETDKPFTLPTEAQWEKAARGNDGRLYPWGNSPPTKLLCNYNKNIGTTTPVGNYPLGVSPYGCHDMAGNVNELTVAIESRNSYWWKGGDWWDGPKWLRASARGGHVPYRSWNFVGFRVVVVPHLS